MIYLLLITLLITLSYFVGWGALVIATYLGFGPAEARLLTVASGVAISAFLWIWAALDRSRHKDTNVSEGE